MKRKTLTTAVLAGLTGMAGMVSVSNAVNLNPDGLGQVLLYPYYTVREGNDTLISIVNTTDNAKSVKIRFLEGVNSREVRDFNIYMSEFDVWVAALTADGDNVEVRIPDSTCTVPYFFGNADLAPGQTEEDRVGTVDFTDVLFTGNFADAGPSDLERVQSGYIEVIEMGTLVDITEGSATAATHGLVDFGGDVGELPRPANCEQLVLAWVEGAQPGYWRDDASIDHEAPSGGLFGAGTIINVANGTMFSYNAEAIDAFSSVQIHRAPEDTDPDLSSGDETSNVFINGVVDTRTWETGVEAVSATILYDTIANEYIIDPLLFSLSEWVVTFPTKRFYADTLAPIGTIPVDPFSTNFSGATGCEPVNFTVWDREEAPSNPVIQLPRPSPVIPGEEPEDFSLCYEANVLRFTSDMPDDTAPDFAEITGEPRFTTFALGGTGFTDGWVRFDFGSLDGDDRVTRSAIDEITEEPTGVGYVGLPVVGFWVNTFTNGAIGDGDVLANYGGTFKHRGSRRVANVEIPSPQ